MSNTSKKNTNLLDIAQPRASLDAAKKSSDSSTPTKTKKEARPLKIFIIGSYFEDDAQKIQQNINKAQQMGIELMKKGHLPLVPQSMYAWWEHELNKPLIMKTVLDWIRSCDAVYVLNLGDEGSGTAQAVDVAQAEGLEIFTDLEEVPQLESAKPKPDPFKSGFGF